MLILIRRERDNNFKLKQPGGAQLGIPSFSRFPLKWIVIDQQNKKYLRCKFKKTSLWDGICHFDSLTEVIFKYVVVMKPTKLGIWFKLGFWDVYSEVLSDTSWLGSMCTTSRNIRGTYSHWSEIKGCFKRHDLDLEMTLLWVKVNLMGTNPAHTSLVDLA